MDYQEIKMANKSFFPIIIIIGFGFSLLIALPSILLSYSLLSYDTIDESVIFNFPDNLSSEVDININADVGDVKIEYIEPSHDTYGRIDINIKMCGADLVGKSYADYFSLHWQTTNSSVNFTMELLSNSWFETPLYSMNDVSILVYLRKDIIFDLSIIIDEGDLEITVPYPVSIGNIQTKVSIGDIFYDFTHCNIKGNITGIVNRGNIKFTTLNAWYTQNNTWNFTIDYGKLDVYIYQYEDLGANITGHAIINNGEISFVYRDDNDKIGARFEIPLGDNRTVWYPACFLAGNCLVEGFDYREPDDAQNLGGFLFTSLDLKEKKVDYYYNLIFDIFNGTELRSFYMDLKSIK